MNQDKLSISDLALQGKSLLMRVDFNVPIRDGGVVDDTRIRAALPSINLGLQMGASVVLMSHLGRPKGELDPQFSLAPVAAYLDGLIDTSVLFAQDCIGEKVSQMAHRLQAGEVLLLENLRFHKEEKSNDADFAASLANLADVYVNDAFGTAHRAHASTVGVPGHLGSGAAGLLMQKELEWLSGVLYRPEKPVVTILGGAKVSDKIEVIENLLGISSKILIGGGMAYTFLKSQGHEVGKSLVEEEKLSVASNLIQEAARRGVELLLPTDHLSACEFSATAEPLVVATADLPADQMGLDIGPDTLDRYREAVRSAHTVLWNGPMGVFEFDEFAQGTLGVAHAVADSDAVSVVGGGDSVAAIHKAGVGSRISHISTGGGASLEFLSGKNLPGVLALSDKS